MDAQLMDWLTALSSTVVRICIILFVALNGAALAAVALKRDRSLVQKYTSPWLAANLTLIGAGIGTPLLLGLTRFAVSAMASAGQMAVSFVK